MCIIALDNRTHNTERIPQDVLARCWETYPDGLGLMYAKDGVLRTWKSLDDFDGLWNRYTSIRDQSLRIALHFRKTTAGGDDIENCHPFEIVPGEFAFMHNGTFGQFRSELPEGVSDTRYLRDEIFRNLPGDFLSRPAFYTLLDSFVKTNRLLFMDNQSRYTIFNKTIGFWWPKKHDVWFSHKRDRSYIIRGSESKSHYVGGSRKYKHWCQRCRRQSDHRTQDHDPDKHGKDRKYCTYCKDYGEHGSYDCPDRPEDDDSDSSLAKIWKNRQDADSDECPWCRMDHGSAPCPQFMSDEGRCVFCGSYGGHVHMGQCAEFDLSCAVCGNAVTHSSVPEVTDGYFHHAVCDVRICPSCGEVVKTDDPSIVIGIQGGRVVHTYCTRDASGGGSRIETADRDPFDDFIDERRRKRDKWQGDTGSEMSPIEVTDDVSILVQSTGHDDICPNGVYLFGRPTCVECIVNDDLVDGWNPHNAWEIPTTRKKDIICVGCGSLLVEGSNPSSEINS